MYFRTPKLAPTALKPAFMPSRGTEAISITASALFLIRRVPDQEIDMSIASPCEWSVSSAGGVLTRCPILNPAII